MIIQVRNFAKSPYALILIVLLVAAFAFTGVPDAFRSSGTAVVIVGNEQVSYQELNFRYDSEMRDRQAVNPDYTRDLARQQGVPQGVLLDLVQNAALRAKANELGLGVSLQNIAEVLRQQAGFQSSVTGRFDNGLYLQLLAANDLNPRRYEELLRQELLSSQLGGSISIGLQPPELMIDNMYLWWSETRDLSALVPADVPLSDIEDPGDEILERVIGDNATAVENGVRLFSVPERRAFTLARFRISDFMSDIDIDEELLRETYEYELEVGEIGSPARRAWTQVYFSDEETATAAAERIAAGEDIALVAAELGGGDPLTQESLEESAVIDEALRGALFDMQAGEARAVEGSISWLAVQVNEAVEGEVPAFEDERERLLRDVAEVDAEQAMYAVLDQFETMMLDGASLEEAAEASGAVLETFPLLDPTGAPESGRPAASLATPGGQVILQALFEHVPGIPMDLRSYSAAPGSRDFFTLRIDDLQDGRLRTLEEGATRRLALRRYRQEEADRRRAETADLALSRIRAGEDFQAVADDIGARVETFTTRRATNPNAPANGPFDYFAITAGYEAARDAVVQPAGFDASPMPVLIRVDAVNQGDLSELSEAERQIWRGYVLNGLPSAPGRALLADLGQGMVGALLTEYDYTAESVDQRLFMQAIGENPDLQ
jgi:peptidyl-prolyl cis-trans isomerase D